MVSLERVRPFIESLVAEMGFSLFDARFFGSGGRSILRLTVDKPGGGVAIADCERVSSAVGALLDERNFFDERPYTLEVSSPGVDRPLKMERDFLRVVGKEVTLHVTGEKKGLRGVVAGCEGGVLVINIDNEPVSIPLADIVSGREEVRFK